MRETYRKKLIEVALPLEAINREAAREKAIRHGHPSTLHLWWARRPLAAARAVLFGQLVDDPSAWPEIFPTEEDQAQERQRLFRLVEELVKWENSANETVINAARLEIARSWARNCSAGLPQSALADDATPEQVNNYIATQMPPVQDPFAGGGTIPLEAQRLGLQTIGSDLNPVATLINKALLELPHRFKNRPPVNPDSRVSHDLQSWIRMRGLAEDVRYYGQWVGRKALDSIGYLYPEVDLPVDRGGGSAPVIAWLWARTVPSPDPALGGTPVPLVSSWWLSRRPGSEAWIEPIVDSNAATYRFKVRIGKPIDRDAVSAGTKRGTGGFRCLLSGAPISFDYVREQGKAGRLGSRLIAIVAEGTRARIFLEPNGPHEMLAARVTPNWFPEESLPPEALGFRVQNYGLHKWSDLFTARQLATLSTLADLIHQARDRVVDAAKAAGLPPNNKRLQEGGDGAEAYGDAVAVYLAFALDRLVDRHTTIASWDSSPSKLQLRNTFARHVIQMTWDYAEGNPFGQSSGSWTPSVEWVAKAVEALLPANALGIGRMADAGSIDGEPRLWSTDPPYYDNIGYADLSDFFYVWLRRSLRNIFPDLFATMLVPKATELVATPFRHGGRDEAERFFLEGMCRVVESMGRTSVPNVPMSIYYAFKQSESDESGTTSTGWETFLAAILRSGLSISGTWPLRSELGNRMRSIGSNALASSVVLVCRPRDPGSKVISRGELRRVLKRELPSAIRFLQSGNIAPVDVAQAAIGPGMAVFSRYASVLEADGTPMSVRSALQLINETLDEYLNAEEAEVDTDTRFAITWYEQHGWRAGPYGDAETLAKARNVSVAGIVEAGFLHAAAGKVRLLKRSELVAGWKPAGDSRPTSWEATQHLIKLLEGSVPRIVES